VRSASADRDELVIIVPGRHPELRVRRIEFEPAIPLLVVEEAGLAIEELPDVFDREYGRGGSGVSNMGLLLRVELYFGG
jgi:hypothetical protein